MDGEQETRHVKKAVKDTPPKADHKHEYVRAFTMSRIRRFDGSVTEEKYKFSLPPECIECGFQKPRARGIKCTEVEVTFREYKRLKEES